MSGLRFDRYRTEGGWESLVRHGPNGAPVVLVLLPFFHEHDRLRRFAGSLMRGLATHDVASACPDRPGENESLQALPASWEAWPAAAQAAGRAVGAAATVAIRSGALLDGFMPPTRRYRFAPATGAALVRDLRRAVALTQTESGDLVDSGAEIRLGGRVVAADLLTALASAEPAPEAARTLRLEGDARPADMRVSGELLWRRAEPGDDPALAAALAADLAAWVRTCAAS